MRVIPDGSVNETKLRELLDQQAEAANLEFKRLRDLDTTEGVVKLALDIAAMQSVGGYIVIGVDDRGTPSGDLSARHAELFDEAVVRDKIKKYVPPPFELRVGRHEVDGALVALVYVPRRASGLTVLAAVGEYEVNERPRRLFGPGDIYVRRGTKKERATQEDIDLLLAEAGLEVSAQPTISRGLIQPPRNFQPPLRGDDRGLVSRIGLSIPSAGVAPLIDSNTRRELGQYLAACPVELQIGQLLPPDAQWWSGKWAEEGFNTAAVATLARRAAATETLWARVAVIFPTTPHPGVPLTILTDAVFAPNVRTRLVGGTREFDGFDRRLDLRQVYELLHALAATALKVAAWPRLQDLIEEGAPAEGPDVFLDAGNDLLPDLIDFGDWRQLPDASPSQSTWEHAPPSFPVDDLEARDRLMKNWLKKTLINAGLRDFEYHLDSFVPRRW